MIRRPRDFNPYLRNEWIREHPSIPYPEGKLVTLLVLTALRFLMRQVDPTGKLPILVPPDAAEGVETQPGVRSKTMGELDG